ncbi:MAG: adenylyl-sulfate kinase [Gammaproteobacteria bacterium]
MANETIKSSNVVWHQATVTRARREQANGHRSFILWFTGLSGAGKSTLAHAVEERLHQMGCRTYVLDGDNVRHGLCADLGFSEADRIENIRRIGEVAKLMVEAGVIAMTAFISPFRAERQKVRSLMGEGEFIEVYCKCSLEICESRDVKGLYAKARAGLIKNYTGISSPYEEPEAAEIVIQTDAMSIDDSVDRVIDGLRERGLIGNGG